VALAAYKNPMVKIMEVGAGTGSATQELLTRLKGNSGHRMYSQYFFTDITPSFLGAAEKSFAEFNEMKFATFDMEQEAATDGFESTFDIVTASNVSLLI